MSALLMEQFHFVKGLDPVADAFAATVASDVINMEGWYKVLFVVHVGVGATGTSTFTVEACDDVTPSNTSAVAYQSRMILSGDTEGAITARATAGFVPTAGSSKILLFEVDASALAASGYGFVRLKAVEVVDSPVLGGILAILAEPRNRPAIAETAIV